MSGIITSVIHTDRDDYIMLFLDLRSIIQEDKSLFRGPSDARAPQTVAPHQTGACTLHPESTETPTSEN